jgi:Pyridoxamine 5'-phosphate oxidase
MGKLFTVLDDSLIDFIRAQRMFFVATAPSGAEGHVNLSPKGLDCLRIFSPTSVGYVDFIGSGAETIAHLRNNCRIVIMFCAFEGPPKILRLHGKGRVIEKVDAEFTEMAASFPTSTMMRSIIHVDLTRIADSCGYSVPVYEFKKDRKQLADWVDRKSMEELDEYQRTRNANSIDGLPALRWVEETT